VYGPDSKPKPGDPTPTALKAAVQHLGMLGVTMQRTVTLDVAPGVRSAGVSDAELDALLARSLAGDDDARATMLALASGKPLPMDATTPVAVDAVASVGEPNGAHP
jgi:hypothetical protein